MLKRNSLAQEMKHETGVSQVLGIVHMKIVFPLFSRLTGKYFLAFMYEMFPRLGEIYFGGLLGGKILREANIQNG